MRADSTREMKAMAARPASKRRRRYTTGGDIDGETFPRHGIRRGIDISPSNSRTRQRHQRLAVAVRLRDCRQAAVVVHTPTTSD